MKYLFFALSLAMAGISPKAHSENAKSVNISMVKIAEIMSRLLPLTLDKNKFKEKKLQSPIKNDLDNLSTTFSQVKNHFSKGIVNYKLASGLIDQYIKDAKLAFTQGHTAYSRKLIQSVGALCVSCHGQDAKSVKLFHRVDRSHFSSHFDFAEFNFMTRRWSAALRLYENFINTFNQSKNKDLLLTALKREIYIYTMILKDDRALINKLTRHAKNKLFGPLILERIKNWKASLEEIEKSPIKGKLSLSKINQFTKGLFIGNDSKLFALNGYDNELKFLRLNRLLNDYLKTSPPSKELPRILLLLSRCHKALNFSLYYSLSDQYLKECMTKYPHAPSAKNCYQEYKNNLTNSFTGSGGTSIPRGLLKELQEYKKKIFSNAKPIKH